MTDHLLVVGGQRCGTTYLYTVLDAHPQITMARPIRPEPKVFLSADASARGLDWYRTTYFADAGDQRLLGEKSTSYLEYAGAAQRASAMLGQAHIVALLREPLARAVSNWQFSTVNGFEDRPLEQALLDNLEHARGWDTSSTSASPYAYLERGRYADYLEPWFDLFRPTVHVRFFEELVGDGEGVSELYAALGVDSSFRPPGLDRQVNRSEASAPELSAELRERLGSYFATSDQRLRERLGRALPWDR